MKKVGSRILSSVLFIAMAAGCMGCAAKKTGTEDGGQAQEHVQQNMQIDSGDGTQGSEFEVTESSSTERGEFPDPVLFDDNCVFDHEMWQKEKTQIQTPGGILYEGESLLVCDMGNHCVVRLTTDGDFVESYGELGSEAGNFVSPTAILLYEDEIYVLDSGNARIQVFDAEMNFDREILFNMGSVPGDGKYIDMAIAGDGTVYIAVDSSYGDGMNLFYLEGEGLCAVPGGVYGYLAEHDGVVYMADMWRYYRDSKGYGWNPGENWIYQVERTGLQKICELPYMYAPADFIVEDDAVYAISTLWGQMNRISMEGELMEELLTEKAAQSRGMYVCMQDEDTFYLAEPGGFLWKVFRVERSS